jgi:hypothetical protein
MSATASYLESVNTGAFGDDYVFLAEQVRRLVPMDIAEWGYWEYLLRTNDLPEDIRQEFAAKAATHRDAALAGEALIRSAGRDVERDRYKLEVGLHIHPSREDKWTEALRADYSAQGLVEREVVRLAARVAAGQPLRWM